MKLTRGTIVQLIAKTSAAKSALIDIGELWIVEDEEDTDGNITISNPRLSKSLKINLHTNEHYEVKA